ncbi:aspartyl protease, partial [Aureobasidium melanogenum]
MQQTLAAIAAIAAVAVASPVEPRASVGNVKFSVPQVATGNTKVAAPAIALAKAIHKTGGTPPSVVQQAAAAAQQSGTVTANSYNGDSEYLCPVSVGGTTLNLDFDTGSADLWVFSTLQSTSQRSGHAVYNTAHGRRLSGETWDISYGDGSGASGVVYADKVVVGAVTATSQAVEAATSISAQFQQDTNNDGLLGLAFSSINTVSPDQQTTFFDTVKNTLARKLFTVDLKKGGPGSYDFGYIDTSKYTGAITYVPVNTRNGFWQFTTTGYSVGSGSTVSSSYSAIADTGTTLMLLPDNVVDAYYAQIPSAQYSDEQGGYVFSCSASLPSFTAVIGGQKFVTPGSYINYASVGGGQCYGGIQSSAGSGISIFGDIFLKAHFVVFSMENSTPQLGFAAQ